MGHWGGCVGPVYMRGELEYSGAAAAVPSLRLRLHAPHGLRGARSR